LNTELEGSDQG